ncbi:MAG: hypothetical protein FJW31_08635 [Acidobacteria bacterium]|nr:hypothetical protein [Acidobacteriota bacterium]
MLHIYGSINRMMEVEVSLARLQARGLARSWFAMAAVLALISLALPSGAALRWRSSRLHAAVAYFARAGASASLA